MYSPKKYILRSKEANEFEDLNETEGRRQRIT